MNYQILSFKTQDEFRVWLSENHETTEGIWLKFYKKNSNVQTIVYAQALDEALCFGWIDSQLKSFDDAAYLQKFTPRKSKSMWSQRNREHVARLIKAGKMTQSGLAQVEAAKKDGRWDDAYASPSNAAVPEDFEKVLKKNKKALSFWKTLNKANTYAYIFRIVNTKKEELRKKKIVDFVGRLERGEKFH